MGTDEGVALQPPILDLARMTRERGHKDVPNHPGASPETVFQVFSGSSRFSERYPIRDAAHTHR